MSVRYTIRCTKQAWSSMRMHTLAPKGAWSSSSRTFSFHLFAGSVTLPWIGWRHPYSPMRYRKILGHRCQKLKHCSTYEQHSITCVQEMHGNMNIYYTGLTNWTINVVWLNPKAPIPTFDNCPQYDIHIFIHEMGKHISDYHNGIRCILWAIIKNERSICMGKLYIHSAWNKFFF